MKNLKITYGIDPNEVLQEQLCPFQYRMIPFSISDIVTSPIHEHELITDEENRKVYHLKLFRDKCFEYEPGYTIGVLPSNSEELVNKLIIRLGLENVADEFFKLSIDENSNKKKGMIPKHLPIFGNLRNVFFHNVDLNSVPKKLFLKSLLTYTKDEQEKENLTLLSSPKGSREYQTLISSYTNRSILGLLEAFPSCEPPVEILLEHLPPLLPRAYSISSSPLNEKYLSITFNVDTFTGNNKGVCSRYLETCITSFKENKTCKIPIYLRTPSNFVLPKENVPIIMIATGTGISPFRSFLEHRHLKISEGTSYAKSWLIYGCRDSGSNYLFKEDLKRFLGTGALSRISECFSRESKPKQYVQDAIKKNSEEFSSWIQNGAVIYVCGDFMKVLPAVKKAIVGVLMDFQELTEEDAQLFVKKMESDGKYVVDSWS